MQMAWTNSDTKNNPLEKMAYDAEASFKRSSAVFDAEKFVAEQLGHL